MYVSRSYYRSNSSLYTCIMSVHLCARTCNMINIENSKQIMQFKSFDIIPGGPKKKGTVNLSGLCSDQQLSFFTLLDRASFPDYNNTKIIKFGWELFILWVISYGLSFSGFARFPEFRGTISMTASAVHKLSEYWVQRSVYCLTRIYNPCTSLALRFLCSWLNAGANTCVGACTCCWSCH